MGELSSVTTALRQWEAARASVTELRTLLESKDAELRELAQEELVSTNEKIESLGNALSVALAPKHPFAAMPCLLEFRPGPGGLESRYFTDSLLRMYQAYCSRKGYDARLVKYEESGSAGEASSPQGERPLSEAVLEIQTPGAYDVFRGEAGIQRVQRIPTTEKSGRTHTSAAALWVLPAFPDTPGDDEAATADLDNPDSDFYIRPSDVREEKMRASGAGGQHVNKTDSAIRLTHEPTGTVVSMQDSRSQHRNRHAAWQLLRARLAAQRREAREEQMYALRNSVLAKDKITRADKIRTFNYGQDRCTDHRSGLDVHNIKDVLDGGESLDRIIDSVRVWLVGRDLRAVIAEEEAEAEAEAPVPRGRK
jgi:peptide chain release factor 1